MLATIRIKGNSCPAYEAGWHWRGKAPASGSVWVPVSFGDEAPAGCWEFPPWSHPQLEQDAGWPFQFHLLLFMTMNYPVPCLKYDHKVPAALGAGAALSIPALEVEKLRPDRGLA